MARSFPTPTAVPSQDEINEFCNAAKMGEAQTVSDYLDRFGAAIIDARDNGHDTALAWAAWMGQAEVAKLLLDRGAAIDKPGMTGRPPIGWAAHGGKREVVELLLARGADIDLRDESGRTPAELAASNNHIDLANYITEHGGARKKAAEELAAQKKAEEDGKTLAARRMDELKKHKPPKLKF